MLKGGNKNPAVMGLQGRRHLEISIGRPKLHRLLAELPEASAYLVAQSAAFQRGGLLTVPHGSGVLDHMAAGLLTRSG